MCFWGEFGASCKVERVHLGVWQDFFSLLGWLFASQTEKKKKKKKKCWFWVSFFFASLCVEVLLFHCSVVMHMRLIAFLVDYLQVKSPARR